jgi:hypothetical protein
LTVVQQSGEKLMSDKDFKDAFPAISEEMEAGLTKQQKIDGVRTLSDESDPAQMEPFTPTVVDYIRRCDTVSQAIEIVEYLLKQNEITENQAREIKRQLKAHGVRSFGTKKESGYYLQHGLE